MFRGNRIGILTRIILVVLLAYLIFSLVSVRQKIADANEELASLAEQVEEQTQTNMELSNAIENRDDPNYILDVARDKLNLVSPTDRVYYITD